LENPGGAQPFNHLSPVVQAQGVSRYNPEGTSGPEKLCLKIKRFRRCEDTIIYIRARDIIGFRMKYHARVHSSRADSLEAI